MFGRWVAFLREAMVLVILERSVYQLGPNPGKFPACALPNLIVSLGPNMIVLGSW